MPTAQTVVRLWFNDVWKVNKHAEENMAEKKKQEKNLDFLDLESAETIYGFVVPPWSL